MAFIVYKRHCWSFLFQFLTTSGKTLLSPTPHPHLALKIAMRAGLAQGLLGLEFTAFAPGAISSWCETWPVSFSSGMCVWLKLLEDVSSEWPLPPAHLGDIWTWWLDPGIDTLCCWFLPPFSKSLILPPFASFSLVLRAWGWRYPIYLGFQRIRRPVFMCMININLLFAHEAIVHF